MMELLQRLTKQWRQAKQSALKQQKQRRDKAWMLSGLNITLPLKSSEVVNQSNKALPCLKNDKNNKPLHFSDLGKNCLKKTRWPWSETKPAGLDFSRRRSWRVVSLEVHWMWVNNRAKRKSGFELKLDRCFVADTSAMEAPTASVAWPQNVTTESSTKLTSSGQIETIFKTLFLVLIAVANVVGNSSICLIVLKDRQLRATVRNYAVASLALSDLLSVQIMIFQVLTYFNIGKDPYMCTLMGRIFGCLLYISILHLFILSLDRYVAIFYPLRYRFMVTPARTAVILLTIWIIPVFSIHIIPAVMVDLRGYASFYGCVDEGSIDIIDKKNHVHMSVNVTFLFFLPLLVMMWAYCRISKVAWYQANRVGVAVISAVRVPHGHGLPRARDRKWAKTLGKFILLDYH